MKKEDCEGELLVYFKHNKFFISSLIAQLSKTKRTVVDLTM